jgi:hypothetical protein
LVQPRLLVAKEGSLPLRHVSARSVADGLAVKEEDSLAERYEISTKVAAAMTDKYRRACAKRLSRSYDILGENVAQANVESFLDAQVEAMLDSRLARRGDPSNARRASPGL